MKKTLSILFLSLMVVTGCSSKKTATAASEKKGTDITFEYTALTRGYYRKATLTPAGISVITQHKGEAAVTEITTAQWNGLVDFYEKNIANKGIALNSLEVPSKKHQFDGALAANLTIKKEGEEFTTQTFDHGNPPAEVKALVDEIVTLAGLQTRE